MLTKIALAAALIVGSVSATLANEDNGLGGFRIPGSTDGVNPVYHPGYFANASKVADSRNAGKASGHARGSYAQAHGRPSPDVEPNPSTEPTGAVQPLTPFERSWFDYQDHE
jgi:hypothetical protein